MPFILHSHLPIENFASFALTFSFSLCSQHTLSPLFFPELFKSKLQKSRIFTLEHFSLGFQKTRKLSYITTEQLSTLRNSKLMYYFYIICHIPGVSVNPLISFIIQSFSFSVRLYSTSEVQLLQLIIEMQILVTCYMYLFSH